nr:MAG TPA: hypothetical protein [Bacteriophage sp.]
MPLLYDMRGQKSNEINYYCNASYFYCVVRRR